MRLTAALASLFVMAIAWPSRATRPPEDIPPGGTGELSVVDPYGRDTGENCPLKHTAVRAEISGFVARVNVTQHYENTTGRKVEAIYTFPLPAMAAVDDMTMTVGDRTIRAKIKEREEARRIYDEARNRGHVASLLDQERPNIFRQSVANIEPGAKVKIVISYVETLKYEEGDYEWSFPMVVGPRYIPRHTPDAAKVNPKYAPPETRAGHDLSLEVVLDAGLPIRDLRSKTHEIEASQTSSSRATLKLARRAVVPNKDFVLSYSVAGEKISDALITHKGDRGGYFTFILQPPDRITAEDVTPKELIFVLDTSGSMSGFPIEKAKETMKLALDGMYPRDTFNLITFAGDTHILFPQPVPATRENLATAQAFLAGRRGGGGTEMMKAIHAALAPSNQRDHVRIVCFMTDGYVGNDFEIVEEVKRNPGARVFSFGIGSSVNRFLLEKMAAEGRGEAEFVGLNDDGSAAARRFHERVRSPLLTDVSLQWEGMPVSDVYPRRIPDLFSARPVVVHGRYGRAASGEITLRGLMSGKPFARRIRVNFPGSQPAHDTMATLWARARIDDLMSQNWGGLQNGSFEPALKREITDLGINYRLMTQFTSFVAVEEQRVTRGGESVVVEVPVEMPDGVSHEGVFGSRDMSASKVMNMSMPASSPSGFAGGVVGGIVGQGVKGDIRMRNAAPPPPPPHVPTEVRKEEDKAYAAKLDPALWKAIAVARDLSTLVTVEVWLADATPEVLAQLKALGFTETAAPRVAKIRRGRIRLDRLEALSKLKDVLSVRSVAQ